MSAENPISAEVLPPILFAGANLKERRWLWRLKAAGRIRPIGPRLYTSVDAADVAEVVRASWTTIVSRLFPEAIVSHRSALEFRPTTDGEVFLTATTNRDVEYPGLRLRFARGPKPLQDDPKFLSLHCSSRARAVLENLASTRPSGRSRVLPRAELEERLEQVLHLEGESGLNALRDRAGEIAAAFGWKTQMERLDHLVGTLMGTRSGGVGSALGHARAAGEPFDARCLERLTLLYGELRGRSLPKLIDSFHAVDHQFNKAFFEAYFSNYIEGTTFEIEEAERIVFEHRIPPNRPKDAHDIAGTHAVVSSLAEMRRTPRSFEELRELLCSRHQTILKARPEAEPGVFKTIPNRAGDTQFVAPAYVQGTLRKGFELYTDLPEGLARAIFVMFLVADVHPFVDGNGRLARIMMNSELAASSSTTIIIPAVYRDDYLLPLRALSRRHRAGPVVDMLIRAQSFSHLEFAPYPEILDQLQRRNWFREPDEAKIVEG